LSDCRLKFDLLHVVISVVFLILGLSVYLGAGASTVQAIHNCALFCITGDYSKTEYSRFFGNKCDKNSNLTIGLLNPTFTAAAHNHAFYDFYEKHNLEISNLKSVKQDVDLLTSEVPNSSAMTPLNRWVKVFPQHIQELIPHAGICILDDIDVHNGEIFKDKSEKTFDVIMLFHEEYTTPQIYENLRNFVNDGGRLLMLSGNIFYAEVRYDSSDNTVTLVNGHGIAFDGKQASKGLTERWENETRQWIGSNYYHHSLPKYGKELFHYPNHTIIEDNYVSNPNANIIFDFGLSDLRYHIAAYELKFGKGKVVSTGIASSPYNDRILKFIDGLLLKNTLGIENITDYIPDSKTKNTSFMPFNINTGVSISILNNDSEDADQIFVLTGNTKGKPASFNLNHLNHIEKDLAFDIGKVLKYGGNEKYEEYDNPISIRFTVEGEMAKYYVNFVQGASSMEGWHGDAFHVRTDRYTSHKINLEELLKERSDAYRQTSELVITIPPNTVVNPFEFDANIINHP
jgi:hypothetical protein